MSRAGRVKNKSAAPVQITAEQLLREAAERQLDEADAPVKRHILDEEELRDFQLEHRQRFEDTLRMKRDDWNTWVRYARFEEKQGEVERARSIMERALDLDYRQTLVWLKYAEMEMRGKHVNHARNVLDRAVALLPREDVLWYRYVFMEEQLGNYAGVRRLFERWMQWEPGVPAWEAYIKFEQRYGEAERSRRLLARLVVVHPSVEAYLRWATFEQRAGETANARSVYEMAVDMCGADAQLLARFAAFECEDAHEVERARAIFRWGLDRVSEADAAQLYRHYVAFEKQHGDRQGIELVIAARRRMMYEEQLQENARNYDVWFDYAALEERHATSPEQVREVYERAIASVPDTAHDKNAWRRYIYLWIRYAVWEEVDAGDAARARQVWRQCLALIPHERFSFTKVWTQYALFEVRQGDLAAARKVFGTALGKAAKPRLFEHYIDLETRLGQTQRARTLYERFVQTFPACARAWVDWCTFEADLHEEERVRALFEVAVQQPELDAPELVWKAYLDWEMEAGDRERVRQLYRRLLEKTQHPRVWHSFASYDEENARTIYRTAYETLQGEQRYQVLEYWKRWELEQGDAAQLELISERMPRRVKKRRRVEGHEEEYYEYVFPDDEANQPNLKLLKMAQAWKKKKEQGEGE